MKFENKQELIDYIYTEIDDKFNQAILDDKEFISTLRKEMAEHMQVLRSCTYRMNEIQKSISAHALGVQNVYEEVNELKSFYKLATVGVSQKENLDKINKILDILND